MESYHLCYNRHMLRILVLEDSEYRVREFRDAFIGNTFRIVDNAKECIEALEKEKWDLIFLDHDLGGESMVSTTHANTGSEVVRWMIDNPDDIPPIYIHSMNVPAAISMEQDLLKINSFVYRIPWVTIRVQLGTILHTVTEWYKRK